VSRRSTRAKHRRPERQDSSQGKSAKIGRRRTADEGVLLRRPSPRGEGRRNPRKGPLVSPAVTHYRCLLCNVTLVPTVYSRNVAVMEHYGEFTPAGSWATGYEYPCNCVWWDIEYLELLLVLWFSYHCSGRHFSSEASPSSNRAVVTSLHSEGYLTPTMCFKRGRLKVNENASEIPPCSCWLSL